MSSMNNLAEALRLKREQDAAASAPANEQAQQWLKRSLLSSLNWKAGLARWLRLGL